MTWNFTTSHIGHDGAGNLTLEICHHRADYGNRFGGVFWLGTPPLSDGTPELDVCCPLCMADRGLTVSGVWGGPAQLTCVCGHSWTPRLPGLSPEDVLRKLVRLARTSSPGPGMPLWRMRADHDAEPPTPLQEAVRPHIVDASRALNRLEWQFSDRECSVASDLLTGAGCRVYWSPEALAALAKQKRTDEDQLTWVHENLQALEDHGRTTRGRLGQFLSDCAAALRPAALLTVDDLEPCATLSGMPPVLEDACGALGSVHVVLTAGATGDVEY
ncbi:hypothetical protein KV557_00980 [Kitasatospora aureofaciens]|uniref:hypothetical protein n=1 Tax=Kitasatospora aureofaciens TaxID=1894 RepID=UPI001C47BA48|nr:hypothetical protein [Kitasatospora aureofaciens]MBV6695697.1 hypothetical protein [Kitasatospora aureofaciens]